MRRLEILMLTLTLLVIVILPAQPSGASLARPTATRIQATNIVIHLNGFVSAWNFSTNANPTITVKQGDMVTVSLVSSDGAPHLFLLDMDKDGSTTATCPTIDPCSVQFPPNTSLSFTAGTPGSYTYFCTIHPISMFATFMILAVSSGGGGGRVYEK
ncbi:MAG TPA: hypothetical protein VFE98_02210 [Candidatus Bathyarchaeia archaeon]|nr:hypothetical protein [Candidatus Bathyarchaeia archaeon]